MALVSAIPGQGDGPVCSGSVESRRSSSHSIPRTTNNRMELMALIQGVLALKDPCEVEITTDSEYVLYGITKMDHQMEAEALVAEK